MFLGYKSYTPVSTYFPFKWSHICRENTFVGCNHDKFLCQCQTAYSVIESCFELLVPQVQLIGCLTGSLWTLLQGLVGVCSKDALFTRMPCLIDLERPQGNFRLVFHKTELENYLEFQYHLQIEVKFYISGNVRDGLYSSGGVVSQRDLSALRNCSQCSTNLQSNFEGRYVRRLCPNNPEEITHNPSLLSQCRTV